LNWQGEKRIPFTGSNPAEFQLEEYSPSFVLMNAQVSKSWNERFDVYLGSENLLGFRQEDAILDAQNPYGDNFDASLVWGPIFGRNVYAGIRYRVFR
ncbi:MAG: TonB-dependent receptor, partial [Saprospiraceae bacterium]|nr:TonB-dependent receptor [Saprospiraceae bacterium]